MCNPTATTCNGCKSTAIDDSVIPDAVYQELILVSIFGNEEKVEFICSWACEGKLCIPATADGRHQRTAPAGIFNAQLE